MTRHGTPSCAVRREPRRRKLLLRAALGALALGALAPVAASAAGPTLEAVASDAALGGSIHDAASLSGGSPPISGTITFALYGPDSAGCTGFPVYESAPIDVGADGRASSEDFTPSAAGVYRWQVSYSGDAGNDRIDPFCTSDASTVSAAQPALATYASDATIGGVIHDVAGLYDGYGPGGTITFRAYGPADGDCAHSAVFDSGPIEVSDNGFFASGDFSPPTTGTYRWTVTYSGDAENAPAFIPCNSPDGASTVALSDIRPADQDADGIPDSIDDCPMAAGYGKTHGCIGIPRALRLKFRRGSFRGSLRPAGACGAVKKVTLLAKRHGQTRKVGAARTDSRGRYAIDAVQRKGSYYVRSLESLEPTLGLCLATQSRRILIG